MVLLLEGYGGGGKGDWSVTIKRYIESTLTDIYHLLYRVTFREVLECYGGWEGKGRLVGQNKKGQYRERVLVYYQIYSIYYTGLHLENSSREVV